MRINMLRGTVADQPIDSIITQANEQPNPRLDSFLERILAAYPKAQEIPVAQRPTYGKGRLN
jgi:hypothetical protein